MTEVAQCWINGQLMPEVDGRSLRYCPGPVFSTLADAFTDLISRETPAR